MGNAEETIDVLQNLGLTKYESHCLVALVRLSHGTAREIAQVADIPRSRVYETMNLLQERGMVELHQSEPRTYQSVSVDTALRILRNEYDSYFDQLEQLLGELEPLYKREIQAVWAINTHEQVTGRVVDLIEEADEEIVLITLDEELLDEPTIAALAEASDRGVDIYIGTVAESTRDRVTESDIEAMVFTTDLIEWFTAMTEPPRIGRLLMADRDPVLVSALHDESLPGIPNETAAWSDGINHGFATFAERVFTYDMKQNLGIESESTAAE